MIKILKLSLVLIFIIASNTYAQTPPPLAFPLSCTLSKNCWIAQYVDTDPSENSAKDFKCNTRTYENHKGTDFALRNRAEMEAGVHVRAAADGIIIRVRNGENDETKTPEQLKLIKDQNKDCGNGIIIDHGNGVQTMYCHLKQSSINIRPKQNVHQGDIIASVGQSGLAEFPHLHFTLLWEGAHIDPFTGKNMDDGCGNFKNNLWKDQLTYTPYAQYDGGFASTIPDFKAINEGIRPPENITATSKAFVFWSSFYQIQKDDEITMKIIDPNGKILAERTTIQDKSRARQHYYTGKKLKNHTLKPGTYTATTTIKSNGHDPQTKTYTIKIP